MQKVCLKCKECKPIFDFQKNKSKSDGLQTYCKVCMHTIGRAYRKQHIQKARDTHRKIRYGITPAEFHLRCRSQENTCPICEQKFTETPHIDHDHTTNEIRGLLCSNCNRGLGLLGDSILVLQNAIQYLSVNKFGVKNGVLRNNRSR